MSADVSGPAAPSRPGAAAAGLLHFRVLLLLLLPLFVLQAGPADAEGVAAPEETAAAEGVAATDFRGKRIELDKPAERIICLLESALTGLYMLGAEDPPRRHLDQRLPGERLPLLRGHGRAHPRPHPGDAGQLGLRQHREHGGPAARPRHRLVGAGGVDRGPRGEGDPGLRGLHRALRGHPPGDHRSRRAHRHTRARRRASRHRRTGAGGCAAKGRPLPKGKAPLPCRGSTSCGPRGRCRRPAATAPCRS